jgi:orotate phosphoribosyltransferase
LESGHHGDLWLDLERLCLHPAPIRRLAIELAGRLRAHGAELVCGPLIEGAFVAAMVAEALDLPFTYAERLARDEGGGPFPYRYRVPGALRPLVAGKRVAIVNDVVNAGSAVRGTLADLRDAGAAPIAIGTLAVLGTAAARLAADNGLALETLAMVPNQIWWPAQCPQCAQGLPLTGSRG